MPEIRLIRDGEIIKVAPLDNEQFDTLSSGRWIVDHDTESYTYRDTGKDYVEYEWAERTEVL